MAGSKEGKDIAGCRLVAPKRKGRVFLDRLLFPETETNDRTTPDMQMPYNNSFDLGTYGIGVVSGNGNNMNMIFLYLQH